MLELQRAAKRYETPGEIVHAVRDVSLTVQAGELVAVLGPSGSGKSTLLLLAAGLLRADVGRVLFEGRDLGSMSRRQALAHRRTQLGFVFQSFNLAAGLTAQENVAIPLLMRGVDHREAHRSARAALAEVALERRLRHTPDRLSGGEQQRVAIARALVGEPKLVLADEPTGNLDSETGAAVLELLAELPRRHGAAVVLVTHDERAAAWADRVLVMRDGALADGREPAMARARTGVAERAQARADAEAGTDAQAGTEAQARTDAQAGSKAQARTEAEAGTDAQAGARQ